jgi:hypothetical protein
MNSQTVPRFWQLYRKLPKGIREQQTQLIPDCIFQRLKNHSELWSVRITRDSRAVGLVDGNVITWFWIGDHEAFERTFA